MQQIINSYSCQLDQTVDNFKRTMNDSKKAEQITVKWQDMARTVSSHSRTDKLNDSKKAEQITVKWQDMARTVSSHSRTDKMNEELNKSAHQRTKGLYHA